MGLFKKAKSVQDLPAGRRRPSIDAAAGRPAPANPAFSYYTQRSQTADNTGRLDATQAAERDAGQPARFTARHRVLATMAGAVFVLAVLYFSLLSTQPNVVLLQDTTTAYFLQDKTVYRQAAQEALASSFFNRNKLTVDTSAVRLSLLKNYPEIKNVSISMPFFGNQPQVYIEPYKPSFILTTATNNAFLLDSTGRALATASQVPSIEKLNIPTLQDKSGIAVKLGNRALPSTTVSFVETVVKALKAKGVSSSTLVLPAGTFQLDVAITGKSYRVKFNLQGDALQQAGAYLATKQRLEQDKITPAEYVDVRVPERAYYK